MRLLKTTFYDTASRVEFTLSWKDEAHFIAARNFLHQLTGYPLDTHAEVDYCILHTAEQREAMYTYRQQLRPSEVKG